MNKKIFNNTGIQFVSLLIVLIFSVVFIIFYVNNKISKLNEINSLQNNLNDFTITSVQLKNSLNDFIKYKHNDVFYETYRDNSTENVIRNQVELNKLLKELEQDANIKRYEIELNIRQNEILLNDFSDKFSFIIQNMIEIGNEKNGYFERLNYSEERLSKILNFNLALFKEIKSLKNQYFQSLSFEKADEFIIKMRAFITKLKQTNNNLLIDASSEYLNNFKQIVKLHKIIGTQNQRGVYNELDDIINELLINISNSTEVAKKHIRQDYSKFKFNIIAVIIFSALIILLILGLMYSVYIKGVAKIQNKFKELVFKDEESSFIDKANFFSNINIMILQLKEAENYKKSAIDDFANGNVENVYNFNDRDILGQSILNLQSKISDEIKNSIIEREKRAIGDKQKEGIAKFGRILRRHVGDINTLSYELISELVNFLNAEIGGVYVVAKQDDKKNLNLRASFAYNEKKMINKQIQFGEGLVGTCALDKSTLFIDKVDDDYIKIVSGFGHTKPTSIIISPIMVDDTVYGVIELGATRLFNENDINFIEALAEDIAYTLSYLLSIEGKDGEE